MVYFLRWLGTCNRRWGFRVLRCGLRRLRFQFLVWLRNRNRDIFGVHSPGGFAGASVEPRLLIVFAMCSNHLGNQGHEQEVNDERANECSSEASGLHAWRLPHVAGHTDEGRLAEVQLRKKSREESRPSY
jgi:hypothetical protein